MLDRVDTRGHTKRELLSFHRLPLPCQTSGSEGVGLISVIPRTHGRIYRFSSLTELVTFCKHRFGTDDVHTGASRGELRLHIGFGDGKYYSELVVPFEGERTYAVLLPEPGLLHELLRHHQRS